MYVWTLNSNMFPKFLYHPNLSRNLLRHDTHVFLPWASWGIQGFLLPGKWCRVLQWCLFRYEVLGHEYNPVQWRLFIDSSKVSLKVVLLHNGNRFPSVPLAHAAKMNESYESMKLQMGKIKYDEVKWKLYGVLNVVALLLGMQLRYTKYCCLLCEWDSRDKMNLYVNKLWPKRTSLTQGRKKSILHLFFRRKFICSLCT
jgi:hypothetical protein